MKKNRFKHTISLSEYYENCLQEIMDFYDISFVQSVRFLIDFYRRDSNKKT